ncbi:hypothetical protein NM208_g9687 [Fusarium decemcellulare]|uniref:Uncharacterized protein n=1 Tax=Fusarium decemcellulare TaxID=57161 RepID=A0ACC1S0T1_9HYPO|nr:hypothetical protein NM208_g9687 [Fusarium decemcellulare]
MPINEPFITRRSYALVSIALCCLLLPPLTLLSASSLISDPATIRSTLLIAAIHLKWRTGGMQSFEPTFLHHQVDAIQTVNNWISKRRPKLLSSIIRQTATLCFIEFCLGRIASAQAHLKGMVSLLNCQIQDLHKPDQGVLPRKSRDDEELNDRYFLLLLTLSNRYKSRLSDSIHSDDSQSATPQEQVSHLDALYAAEMKCDAAMKLELLCMMPFFCQPLLSGAHWCWIDGAETIRDLRELTHSLDQIQSKVNVSRAETEFAMACANGVASHLHMRYIESHISSVFNPKAVGSRRSSGRKRRAAGLDTTWCGLYAATSLYLHDVLGIGLPEDPDCHRHTMYTLKRSLCNHLDVLVNGTSATEHLLFWQIFLGAVSVQRISRQDMPWLTNDGPSWMDFFSHAIWTWSRASGIIEWRDARAILESIAWPFAHAEEDAARDIWNSARFTC